MSEKSTVSEGVVEAAPAMGTGQTMMSMSHSMGLMFESAVSQQHLDNMTTLATTTKGVCQFLDVDELEKAKQLVESMREKD